MLTIKSKAHMLEIFKVLDYPDGYENMFDEKIRE